MTSTENAYVAGIIDGEGHVEFKMGRSYTQRSKRNSDLPDTYCPAGGASSRQTTHRLADGNNKGRNTGHQTLPRSPNLAGSTSLACGLSWCLPGDQTSLSVLSDEEAEGKTYY